MPDETNKTPSFDRIAYETLALRLNVHGPEAANDRELIRWLSRGELWLETRNLLRTNGFSAPEIALMMDRHPRGCACWGCVMNLRMAVRRSLEDRKKRLDSAHDSNRRPRRDLFGARRNVSAASE